MEHSFSINWGEVSASGEFPHGWQIFALWPAPVNEDECFAAAGFTHFKYEDEGWSEQHWDEQAEILQQRLLAAFSALASPALLGEPLRGKRSMLRFWQPGEPLPLAEQLRWPILHDSLPEVAIRFGDAAELRAGSGHELYWIGLSPHSPLSFDALLAQVAIGWPVKQVQLDWSKLGMHHAQT
ncbi:MAG: hypothetical protein PHQ60_16460 [Sideroxydans sp.]|nr:hypothetical protein [Sideroxydans sp.]